MVLQRIRNKWNKRFREVVFIVDGGKVVLGKLMKSRNLAKF